MPLGSRPNRQLLLMAVKLKVKRPQVAMVVHTHLAPAHRALTLQPPINLQGPHHLLASNLQSLYQTGWYVLCMRCL
jgi:hypothetical protein